MRLSLTLYFCISDLQPLLLKGASVPSVSSSSTYYFLDWEGSGSLLLIEKRIDAELFIEGTAAL